MAPATMIGYVVLRIRHCFPEQSLRRGLFHALAAAICCLSLPATLPAEGIEDLEQPILLADAGNRFRDPPRPAERYESRFSDPGLSPPRPSIPLTDFTGAMYQYEAGVVAKLPAEDFKELDEYFPKLTTASLDANDQRSVVGGRLLLKTPLSDRATLHSEARLLWLSEFLQSPGSSSSAFFAPGDSAIYVVQGLGYGSNWAILGGRIRWELIGGLSAFAGYDTQANSQQMFHIGSTGLDYAW